MGARARKNGLHCSSFPANSSNLPVEVLEATVPVRVHTKRIRRDSGGEGAHTGGCGQEFEFESISELPMMVRASHGKLAIPPKGLLGGRDGRTGGIYMNDRPIADKTPVTLRKGDVVRLETPGSGGMGQVLQQTQRRQTAAQERAAEEIPEGGVNV
jgi:N-methylhydantoinase B